MNTDFVDCAVSGWAKQMPGVDTSALEVTGRLERIARHLDRRTTEAVAGKGLSCRDLDVLGALRRAEGNSGLPASECAKAAMVTSGGMTGEADKLAGAGLIVRKPDPDDRRAVLMALTPEGTKAVDDALQAYLDQAEEALAPLTSGEQAILAELLRKLLVGLEGTRTVESQEKVRPARARDRRLRRFENA